MKPKKLRFEFLLSNLLLIVTGIIIEHQNYAISLSVFFLTYKKMQCLVYLGVFLKQALRKHLSDHWSLDTDICIPNEELLVYKIVLNVLTKHPNRWRTRKVLMKAHFIEFP